MLPSKFKKLSLTGLVYLSLFLFIFLPFIVSAAGIGASGNASAVGGTPYVPLAPITGYLPSTTSDNLTGYLNGLFRLGVAIATGLAVVMIVLGGIKYMSTDAIGGKEDGKDKITSALWGLLIALGAYLLLNTINPQLLNTEPNIGGVNVTADSLNNPRGQAPTGSGVTPVGLAGGDSGVAQIRNESDGTYTDYNNGYTGVNPVDGSSSYFIDPNGNVVNGMPHQANNVALDTDGGNNPGWDSTWTSGTSYQPNGHSLDAFNVPYVAVPSNSGIPMGTPVLITDNTAQPPRSIMAVAGDNGATGWGEMSPAAANALGLWSPGNNNNINQSHNITFTFYGTCSTCHQ